MGKSRNGNPIDLFSTNMWTIALFVVAAIMCGFLVIVALFAVKPTPTWFGIPASSESPMSTPEAAEASGVAPITQAEGTRTLVFGDSWTAGYAAAPSTDGYAYLTGTFMKWENTVDGVGGTGYLNAGPNQEGTYIQRIEALDASLAPQLIILQGGINDAYMPADELSGAATAVVDALRVKFPEAQIVMFGPASPVMPVDPRFVTVDSTLKQVAAAQGLNYISPLDGNWITEANYADVIDTAATNHPSTAGHAYLAQKLEEAIAAITG